MRRRGGDGGDIDDPSASPLAVAAVLEGRRLYARRAELQQVIEVTDPPATRNWPRSSARRTGTPRRSKADDARRDIEDAMATAARVADGGAWGPELARLACAMTDPRVRDTLYALAVGDRAAQA